MATPFVRKECLIFGSTPRTRRGDRAEALSDVIGFLSGLRESLGILIRTNELLPSLSLYRSSFSSRWAVLLGSRHSQPCLLILFDQALAAHLGDMTKLQNGTL